MNKKDMIDTICNKTGISIRELARLLGTSHTVLSRYATGTRSLPVAALQQLVVLHQLVNHLPPVPEPMPTAAEKEAVQEQLTICREKITRLQKKLSDLLLHWQSAMATLQMTDSLVQTEKEFNPKKQRWLDEQRYQAGKLLLENGWAAQQKIRLQIALLEKEVEWHNGLVNGPSVETHGNASF